MIPKQHTGLYASINFLEGHATRIAGPDGVEQRGDIHLGVTAMAYTRYPNHRRRFLGAFAALSPMEVRSDENS
ncbi:dimethylsulfonioproprionate lyase family protein [Rhizobium jaguaris]|uniref:dimethylsulfonioproprionate lyase family protein n=1 Tax=Rhizobium jaguaris TaxID=1312183 RepID=UPI0013C484CD